MEDKDMFIWYYRKISNISRTTSQNLNDSCLVLQLSLPNPLKPGVKVIHKENSRFLNRFFPIPCLYHELSMIIHTRYINI